MVTLIINLFIHPVNNFKRHCYTIKTDLTTILKETDLYLLISPQREARGKVMDEAVSDQRAKGRHFTTPSLAGHVPSPLNDREGEGKRT